MKEADPKVYGWVHLFDRSHVHLSMSKTEPPRLDSECVMKAIYYDENATAVVQPFLPDQQEFKCVSNWPYEVRHVYELGSDICVCGAMHVQGER